MPATFGAPHGKPRVPCNLPVQHKNAAKLLKHSEKRAFLGLGSTVNSVMTLDTRLNAVQERIQNELLGLNDERPTCSEGCG